MSNYWKSYYYMKRKPFIIAYNDKFTTEINRGVYSDYFLHMKTILHELCHQHQIWYTNKFYNTYSNAQNDNQSWYRTKQGKDFIKTIGYIYDDEEGYYLEENNTYNLGGIYSTYPIELAAEVCANYMLEKIYENYYPELFENMMIEGRGLRSAVITPETIEWMEEYVVVTSPATASRR